MNKDLIIGLIFLVSLASGCAATAGSMPGLGCSGGLDNVHDANGYFARCSADIHTTLIVEDMISCDGVPRSVLFSGAYYLGCSGVWHRGIDGLFTAICGGDFFDDPSGHYVVCSMPWTSIPLQTPIPEITTELWLSHLGGLLGAYVLGLCFGGLQAYARALLSKFEDLV